MAQRSLSRRPRRLVFTISTTVWPLEGAGFEHSVPHERDYAFRDRPFDHFGNSAPAAENRSLKFQLRAICGGQLKRRDLFFMAPSPGFHQKVVAIRGGPSIPARARSLAPERASGKTEDGTRRRSRSGALDLPCAPTR